MKSRTIKIIGAVVLLARGVFMGKYFFSGPKESTTPMPTGISYRGTGSSTDTLLSKTVTYDGNIIEVKKGGSIKKAVESANPGDLIRIYPGTYYRYQRHSHLYVA